MKLRKNDAATEPDKKPYRVGGLLQNAAALMLSAGGTAMLGLVFWGLAAHLEPAATVGKASAEITAMTLLANVAQLSFGPIFERFLPVAGDRTRRFVTRAYSLSLSVALVVSVSYVLLGLGHNFIPPTLGWKVLFVVSVLLWTIFVLQDNALIALRSSRWVPVENIAFALAKLALLPVLIIVTSREGVFLAWTSPVAIAIVGVSWYLFGKRIPEHMARNASDAALPRTREIIFLAAAQYGSWVVNVLSSSIVSLIVIDRLGPVANAYYYLPAVLSSGPALMLISLVTSFMVEASSEPEEIRKHAKTTVKTAFAVLLPSMAIGEIFAPDLLRIFGSTYAQHGTTLLRMLILSLPGMAITSFYSTFAWLDKNVWWLALRELVAASVYFTVLFIFIGHFGIFAVGIASVTSSGLQGLFFLPISIRRYKMTARTTSRA